MTERPGEDSGSSPWERPSDTTGPVTDRGAGSDSGGDSGGHWNRTPDLEQPPQRSHPPYPTAQPAPYAPQHPPYPPHHQPRPPYGAQPPPYAPSPAGPVGYPPPGYRAAPPTPYPAYGPAPGYPAAPVPAKPGAGAVVIEPAPGGDFGMALLPVPPTTSGLAIGSLVAGIASILVSVAVFCFGISAKPLVALAFGLLAGFIGAAGLVLGL